LVRAAHDLSEGGLAVAAAEMALAGRLGLQLDLNSLDAHPATALFAETNGCLLLEVAPENSAQIEAHFDGLPLLPLGTVSAQETLTITHNQSQIINLPLSDLITAFKGADN
jgi:phosphoribosylformylglycinamidine synthase